MATDIESFVNVQPNICIVIRHDEYIFYRPKRRQAMVRSRSDTARRNGHIIWLFAGADTGAETLARAMTIIETAKMNGIDPQAYLADVLDRIEGA